MRTNDLYFVADGSGGHVFAATLADHNRNVQRWRSIERDARIAPSRTRPNRRSACLRRAGAARRPGRPRRRGAGEGGPTFGALPDRLGVADAAHAAITAGPDLQRAAAAMGLTRRTPVESSRDWAGRMALAFAASPAGLRRRARRSGDRGRRAGRLAFGRAIRRRARPRRSRRRRSRDRPERRGDGLALCFPVGRRQLQHRRRHRDRRRARSPARSRSRRSAASGPMVTFPVSAARQADLRARAAQYAGGLPAASALPITGGVRALPIIDAPPSQPVAAPAEAPKRPRVVDASEGTRLDPLKMANWDLNSPKSVPDLRPRAERAGPTGLAAFRQDWTVARTGSP
ncbi:MAG: hypothetical protein HZY79_13315 [Rhodoblastus sp.]|nr:MAG: hypothetical protein HZY79_13315 [Rhodoblastus sp.]